MGFKGPVKDQVWKWERQGTEDARYSEVVMKEVERY
jgi:hypothetical protein